MPPAARGQGKEKLASLFNAGLLCAANWYIEDTASYAEL
jgi:hypothetical protein